MLRTLHPMLVHFPISLFWTAALFELLYVLLRRDWLGKAGLTLLTLGLLAGAAAGIAGVLSERYVLPHLTPAQLSLLSRHKHMAELSVAAFGAAWLVRVLGGLRRQGPLAGRPLAAYSALLLVGLGLISYTGYLGGTMVYRQGIGIFPARAQPAPAAASASLSAAARGALLYRQSCASCHGTTLGRWVVSSLGGLGVTSQWIQQNMPPQAPGSLSRADSRAIAAYLASQ